VLSNVDASDDIRGLQAAVGAVERLEQDITVAKRGLRERIGALVKAVFAETDPICEVIADRTLRGIPDRIAEIKAELQSRENARYRKARALRDQGFSDAEILNIVPPVSEADREAAESEIRALEAELKAYSRFNRSLPFPDWAALLGTAVAGLIPVQEDE
jgi:hypothetical protein